MRNPVARHDHNRAAVHPDRSKRPLNSVVEGLLDYFAENAQSVAEDVYRYDPFAITVPELTEEEKRERILKVDFNYPPAPKSFDPKKLKLFIAGVEVQGFSGASSLTAVKEVNYDDYPSARLIGDPDLEGLFSHLEEIHDCSR